MGNQIEYAPIQLVLYEQNLLKAREFAEEIDFENMCYWNECARRNAKKCGIDIEDRIRDNINIAHNKKKKIEK